MKRRFEVKLARDYFLTDDELHKPLHFSTDSRCFLLSDNDSLDVFDVRDGKCLYELPERGLNSFGSGGEP